MLDTIAPGTRINVKVVKTPTNAAAAKTIVRLLGKDKAVQANDRRLLKAREIYKSQHVRGGRVWTVKVPKQPAVEAKAGVTGTITATLDVLRDLKSVVKFLQITPA